jgi:putative salt-induced outer membrane protein YdiY
MFSMVCRVFGMCLLCLVAVSPLALAQAPPAPGPPAPVPAAPPPKTWTATASAGLSLTSGNTRTSTINVAYTFETNEHAVNRIKSDGLLIRGTSAGVLATDRANVNLRDEYRITPRGFVFGQVQYLRDRFKRITFLTAPTVGAGLKLVDEASTHLSVDASMGGVWEKNPLMPVHASGAVTMDEKFDRSVTATATLTQEVAALWKTVDTADALYTFKLGLAATISARTQLKVEAIDTYKNRPPEAATSRNDVAVLLALVYKM